MTALLYVADEADTLPFVGFVAPLHVTGCEQVLPVQPVAQAHEKPLAPTVVHMPPFAHGFGEHPVVMSAQDGALPLHVPSAWQVRVEVPPVIA